jgi:hypothetical protein
MFFRRSSDRETTVFGLDDVRSGALERLEDRLLMAVNISQVGSTLTIAGDANDNIIHLADFPEGVRVSIDGDGVGGPDLNELYYGVSNVTINTGNGDDRVGVSDLTIAGNLIINTGAGDDDVYVSYDAYYDVFGLNYSGDEGDNTIYGNVSINLGAGDDDVVVGDSTIGGAVSIIAGIGNDSIRLGHGDVGTFVYGNVSIDSGTGEDWVILASSREEHDLEINGDLLIKTGSNYDRIDVYAEDSNDSYYGDVVVNGKTTIDLGAGDDRFVSTAEAENGIAFNGAFVLKAGDGQDVVSMYGDVDFGANASFDLGKGNDFFRVSGLDGDAVDFYGDLSVLGGAHNDTVRFGYYEGAIDRYEGSAVFHYGATFDGGAGLNRLEVIESPAVYGEFPVFKRFVVFQQS